MCPMQVLEDYTQYKWNQFSWHSSSAGERLQGEGKLKMGGGGKGCGDGGNNKKEAGKGERLWELSGKGMRV